MKKWKISPQYKNKIIEQQYWYKGSLTISRRETFEYSEFVCWNHTMPDMNLENIDGIELTKGTEYSWSLLTLVPKASGSAATWLFPSQVSSEEQTKIKNLIGIDIYKSLDDSGWVFDRSEYWFHNLLKIEEIEEAQNGN